MRLMRIARQIIACPSKSVPRVIDDASATCLAIPVLIVLKVENEPLSFLS